jgi:threonine dehydratase
MTLQELELAAAVVYRTLRPTPQLTWPLLNARAGAEVWLKHENQTPVGAFKIRGGLVYVDELMRGGSARRGVVAATRGNHGQSVGFAARLHGIPAAIVVPHGNSTSKNAAMRALGVELIVEGHDFQASLEAAARIAAAREWHLVPSFHPSLVKGVATYSLELLRGVSDLDALYVPIGLGSGICGAIAARDALGLTTRIVGVVSASAPAYARSLAAGHVVSHDVTTRIADGMACRTPNADALAWIRRGADRVVEVTDDQVEAAMRAIYDDTHNATEGAGAAAVAALLADRDAIAGRRVAAVLTGANADRDVFARVLAGTVVSSADA